MIGVVGRNPDGSSVTGHGGGSGGGKGQDVDFKDTVHFTIGA